MRMNSRNEPTRMRLKADDLNRYSLACRDDSITRIKTIMCCTKQRKKKKIEGQAWTTWTRKSLDQVLHTSTRFKSGSKCIFRFILSSPSKLDLLFPYDFTSLTKKNSRHLFANDPHWVPRWCCWWHEAAKRKCFKKRGPLTQESSSWYEWMFLLNNCMPIFFFTFYVKRVCLDNFIIGEREREREVM